MPQFDQCIIISEIFWVSLIFLFFYFLIAVFNKKKLLYGFSYKKYWLTYFLKFSNYITTNKNIVLRFYVNLYKSILYKV